MEVEEILERVTCCACGGKLDRLNLVELDRRAKWRFPIATNILTNEGDRAVAIYCDACVMAKADPVYAVEFTGKKAEPVKYHPVDSLAPIEPFNATYKIFTVKDSQGKEQKGIECLGCGKLSYNPNDIKYRYCGYCNRFHELG